ncbi:MAG: rod shape-determining protein MreD [Celeribacter sp.]|jgi:rod shape-determining protein MreD
MDPLTVRLWAYRALYLGIVGLCIFFRVLPLDTRAGLIPGPDVILALTAAWVLRRPDFVPAVLIVLAALACDLIFQRPPGLWAMLMLLGTEFLRARQGLIRELPFFLEWVFVGGVVAAMITANQLLLALVMTPRPPIGLSALQGFLTVAVYPAVVAVSHLAFGLHKAAPGEVDALGHRL